MRPAEKPLTCILVIALLALLSAAGSAAAAPSIPGLPEITQPEPDDIASFTMTARGSQHNFESFYRDPSPTDGCSLRIEGTLSERWNYTRENNVTMEFRKYGNRVYLQRANRKFGDAAFATRGTLLRTATGSLNVFAPPACQSFTLVDPICGQTLKAPLDLALSYSGGTISVKGSGPSAAKPNPAKACGELPAGGTTFDHLTGAFPFLYKQKAKLLAKTIFDKKKRKILLHLKDNFLKPADTLGFTRYDEDLRGGTTIHLQRR